jgi:putative ABC transport system ATP-binding protein
VLEARGLSKTYGDESTRVEALKEVCLQFHPGEMVAIMGPSGSGKSTLLSLLGAMDSPSQGQVLLEGVDLSKLDDTARTLIRRRRIGFIFQAFNLLPILSALENVALPLELDGVAAQEARDRARQVLGQVGMEQRLAHLPGMMSGGEQQRVAIARALVIQPALLLADEPTGNLDTATGTRIVRLIRDLVDQQSLAVVLVTHDNDVANVADRVVRLRDGRLEGVQEAGSPPRT